MTLGSPLPRIAVAAAAVVAIFASLLALIPMMLPTDTVRATTTSELGRRLGMPIAIRGGVTLTVFPQLAVRIDDVRFGAGRDPDGEPPVKAESIIGTVRLLPLLAGRIVISDYTIQRPQILVQVAPDGRSNWDSAFETLRRGALDRQAGLTDFRITEGKALVIDGMSQARTEVSGIDLAVSWPGGERQANISGRMTVKGEALEISAVLARPQALFIAEPTGLKMRFASGPLRGGFEGSVTNGNAVTAAGALTVEGPSLRSLLRWLGQNPGIGPSLAAFALKGQVEMLPGSFAFSKVNAELDGNVAEGALTVNVSGDRPLVRGTLDAGRVVATTYFRDLHLSPEPGRGWNRRPLDLSAIAAIDIDLRVSARELVIGQAELGRSAALITARNGRLSATLGEAQAYGGTMNGTLSVAPAGDDMDLRATINVQRAQLGQGFGEWLGLRRLDGTANVQAVVEARGDSMATLARTATGQVTLTAVDGSLQGFNAEAILRRLERRPLAAAGQDARSGRTPYDRISATVRIVGGVAVTTDMVLEGQVVTVRMEGMSQLPTRDLDMRGVATLKRTASANPRPGEGNFELPFVVQGSWDDPFVLPDPQILIRRSGAAAPLRDTTRDRDALKAVLDAINRNAGFDADGLPPPATAYGTFPPAVTRP